MDNELGLYPLIRGKFIQLDLMLNKGRYNLEWYFELIDGWIPMLNEAGQTTGKFIARSLKTIDPRSEYAQDLGKLSSKIFAEAEQLSLKTVFRRGRYYDGGNVEELMEEADVGLKELDIVVPPIHLLPAAAQAKWIEQLGEIKKVATYFSRRQGIRKVRVNVFEYDVSLRNQPIRFLLGGP